MHQCDKRMKTKTSFLGLIPTFVDVIGEKLVRGLFAFSFLAKVIVKLVARLYLYNSNVSLQMMYKLSVDCAWEEHYQVF